MDSRPRPRGTGAGCRRWGVAVSLMLCALVGGSPAGGAERGRAPAAPALGSEGSARGGMDERVSLDLRGIDVTDALKFLALKGGLNIAASPQVQGQVTLFLTDVPIRDVFDVILRGNGLAYDRRGSVYQVMTEAEYQAVYGQRFADQRVVRTFRLRRAAPARAAEALGAVTSAVGRVLVDPESGTVLIVDTPEQVAEMEAVLAALEGGHHIQVFQVRYARAEEIARRLRWHVQGRQAGSITADDRSHQVIVEAYPDRMQEIAVLISQLDQPQRTVLIDATILRIRPGGDRSEPVDWEQVLHAGPAAGLGGPVRGLRVDGRGRTGRFLVGAWPEGEFRAARRSLERVGEVQVVSSPRFAVMDGHEARVHVGTREPYGAWPGSVGSGGEGSGSGGFLDVGVRLVVVPLVHGTDELTLIVRPEVSEVARGRSVPGRGVGPVVDTARAETAVLVRSGATVVIAGLRNAAQRPDEVVVLVTPTIMRPGERVVVEGTPAQTGLKPFRDYAPEGRAGWPARGWGPGPGTGGGER